MAENDEEVAYEEETKFTKTRTAVYPTIPDDNPPPESDVAPAPEDSPAEKEVAAEPQTTDVDTVAMAGSYEVDVDLADAGMSEGLESKKRAGRKKQISLLGSNLSQKPAAREGKNAKNTALPLVPGTKRPVVDRYAAEVREADRNRKLGFLPMQEQIQFTPAGFDVARDLRAELQEGPKEGVGWDEFLGTEKFQKRMQFLHEHARTGHFIERYGAEGTYEGDFMHGMRHGKGKYEFRKETMNQGIPVLIEEVYDGEWKWDHRHGWGELQCTDGTTIKGEFQNGKLNGYASVVDQKGTVVYEGEFKDGKRHGLGRQLFESGDMYDGGWQSGRLHDRGVYYFTNGDRLYGMWREGIYDGVGVFHYADGSISRREYRDGLLMSVQDYEHASQRFGKTLTRGGMQKHTRDRDFPKEVFLLNSV